MKGKLRIWYKKYDNSILLKFLYVLFISIPPAVLLSLDNTGLKNFINTYLRALTFLFTYKGIFTGIGYAWVPFWVTLTHILSGYIKREIYISDEGFITLFTCIENILWKKSNRIANALKTLPNSNSLKSILNPERQIKIIIDTIWIFFREMDKNLIPSSSTTFRITLIECENNTLKEYFAYAPENETPRTPVAELNNQNSSAMTALITKDINIVEDFIKEGKKHGKRRFKITSSYNGQKEGCIISYPIYDRELKEVAFILNVCCEQIKYFKESNKKMYQYILKKFGERILFENRFRRLIKNLD